MDLAALSWCLPQDTIGTSDTKPCFLASSSSLIYRPCCSNGYAQSAIWLQLAVSAELLIFVTRAPGVFFLSRPSYQLMFSALICGAVLCSFLVAYAFDAGRSGVQQLLWYEPSLRCHFVVLTPLSHREDIGIIWGYNIGCLLFLDAIKIAFKHSFDFGTSGVLDEPRYELEDSAFRREADPHVHAITVAPKPAVGEIPPYQPAVHHDARNCSERISEFMYYGRRIFSRSNLAHRQFPYQEASAAEEEEVIPSGVAWQRRLHAEGTLRLERAYSI